MTELENVDVLVIGAGLVGRTIGKHLARQGRRVTIVDAEFDGAGSKPAACVMRPSWLTNLTKTQQAQSFSVLDSLFGVHEIEAFIQPLAGERLSKFGKRTTVHWVAPPSIFKVDKDYAMVKAKVVDVGQDHLAANRKPWFLLENGDRGEATMVIVAAGVWSGQFPSLGTIPGLTAQAGAAFLYPCDEARETRITIRPWAPYKQLVMVPNLRPGKLWVGDGTALLARSLTDARIKESRVRCDRFVGWDMHPTEEEMAYTRAEGHKAVKMYGGEYVEQHPVEDLGEPDVVEQIVGLRPYIKGMKGPAYVQEAKPGVWIATGGAKNGTAGAGWAAYELADATN